MPKSRFVKSLAALAIALVGLLAISPAALAASASSTSNDNPNGSITVTGDPWPPLQGQSEVLTGTVVFPNDSGICTGWTLTFDGVVASGTDADTTESGNTVTFTHVFAGPSSSSGKHVANATCTAEIQVGYNAFIDPTLTTEHHPLVADVGGAGHGGLPNTGGPSYWWLIAAILSLLAGGTAVATSRKKQHETV